MARLIVGIVGGVIAAGITMAVGAPHAWFIGICGGLIAAACVPS